MLKMWKHNNTAITLICYETLFVNFFRVFAALFLNIVICTELQLWNTAVELFIGANAEKWSRNKREMLAVSCKLKKWKPTPVLKSVETRPGLIGAFPLGLGIRNTARCLGAWDALSTSHLDVCFRQC